jgi:glucose/arabinose dehydrogenase
VSAPPDDHKRLFVVEQQGRVRVVVKDRVLRRPFINLRKRVTFGGERGLLSIAFAPDYERSRRFYVYYTAREVDGFALKKGNPNRADPKRRRLVLTIPHSTYPNHNGGQLQFGPDRLLYIGTGDGGAAYDPDDNAQNPESLLGKLLRINPRRKKAKPEIYALGLRNPWRFSFDRRTDDLVIADVGQNVSEEVNFLPAGTPPGTNFGWSAWEGSFPAKLIPPPDDHTLPVLEHDHLADGYCAITGGYVVRDRRLDDLFGRYVYGDYCQTELRSAQLALPEATDDQPLGVTITSVSSFGEDAGGCVYATSLDGDVVRLQANDRPFRRPCRKRSG